MALQSFQDNFQLDQQLVVISPRIKQIDKMALLYGSQISEYYHTKSAPFIFLRDLLMSKEKWKADLPGVNTRKGNNSAVNILAKQFKYSFLDIIQSDSQSDCKDCNDTTSSDFKIKRSSMKSKRLNLTSSSSIPRPQNSVENSTRKNFGGKELRSTLTISSKHNLKNLSIGSGTNSANLTTSINPMTKKSSENSCRKSPRKTSVLISSAFDKMKLRSRSFNSSTDSDSLTTSMSNSIKNSSKNVKKSRLQRQFIKPKPFAHIGNQSEEIAFDSSSNLPSATSSGCTMPQSPMESANCNLSKNESVGKNVLSSLNDALKDTRKLDVPPFASSTSNSESTKKNIVTTSLTKENLRIHTRSTKKNIVTTSLAKENLRYSLRNQKCSLENSVITNNVSSDRNLLDSITTKKSPLGKRKRVSFESSKIGEGPKIYTETAIIESEKQNSEENINLKDNIKVKDFGIKHISTGELKVKNQQQDCIKCTDDKYAKQEVIFDVQSDLNENNDHTEWMLEEKNCPIGEENEKNEALISPLKQSTNLNEISDLHINNSETEIQAGKENISSENEGNLNILLRSPKHFGISDFSNDIFKSRNKFKLNTETNKEDMYCMYFVKGENGFYHTVKQRNIFNCEPDSMLDDLNYSDVDMD